MDGTTPMMQQYRAIKKRCGDTILFFRLGDFYEMFFDDAVLAARELEITLTGRDAGKDLGRVPMCGVPYHSAGGYVQRLLEKGHKVAICDQVEDPGRARGLVRREVVRIITPGTLVDPAFLEDKRNNFIVCLNAMVSDMKVRVLGLAVADVSTGEFAATQWEGETALASALEEIFRLGPSELVMPDLPALAPLLERVRSGLGVTLTERSSSAFELSGARHRLLSHFCVASLKGFGLEDRPGAVSAAGALLEYLADTQKGDLRQFTGMVSYSTDRYLTLDPATRRNLELTRRLSDGSKNGTLLWVIDQTATAMGGRRLRNWIEQPLLSVAAINGRLDAVEALTKDGLKRAEIRGLLRSVYDVERLSSRTACGMAGAKDLAALRTSLTVVPRLKELLGDNAALAQLGSALNPLPEVVELIARALVDDPPLALNEGGLIRTGYSQEVDQLREASRGGKRWIAALEEQERRRTGIKSIKVGFNKVFGYYLEVTKANLSAVPDDYIRKQTLAGGERFVTQELKEQESLILGAEEKLASLEYRIFTEVRSQVAAFNAELKATAEALGRLDALTSLAEVAVERGYVRPVVDDSDLLIIKAGRHPVLDRILQDDFVPNDAELDTGDRRLAIITGPNMGGKSTYLRQTALIVLMAQMGAFVPAKSAVVGVADRIFTRVGASDDLSAGQSTFMVEMTETAAILNLATRRSLVLLDEIGRGTSTYDGLSIARAVAEYLHDQTNVGCRALFATHYHELTELAEILPGVRNYSVAVREKGDEIIFLRRIITGGSDRSYGIQCARLAGLPRAVIERAREILAGLEAERTTHISRVETAAAQLSFLEVPPHPVVTELTNLDLAAVTPIEALNTLYRWQERLKKHG